MWIEPLEAANAPPAIQDLYEKIRSIYGAVIDPIAAFAQCQAALQAYIAFEREIQKAHHLPKKLNYLVNLHVAKRLSCPFCVDIGLMLAMEAGVTRSQIDELSDYAASSSFTESERVALEYCDVMAKDDIETDVALQRRLRASFTTPAIVELTAIIAWEQFRSRFNRALGIEAHGFVADTAA